MSSQKKTEAPVQEVEKEITIESLKEIANSIMPILDQIKKLSEEQIDFIIFDLIRKHPQKAFDNICMTIAHETIYLKKDINETKKILFNNMDKVITEIYNGTKDRLDEEMEKKDDKS